MKKGFLFLTAISCLSALSLFSATQSLAQTPGSEIEIGAFLPYYRNPANPENPWSIPVFEQQYDPITGLGAKHDLDIFLWYKDWSDPNLLSNPNILDIAGQGRRIELAWEPHNYSAPAVPYPQCDPAVPAGQMSLKCMWQGGYDDIIDSWAQSLRDFDQAGYTVLFRPMSEMNYDWTDWGTGNPTNLEMCGDITCYQAAWRHLHFRIVNQHQIGANVKWLWAPNRDDQIGNLQNSAPGTARYTYNKYYPGDDVVDYIGIDGYNRGCYTIWYDFGQVFGPSYDVFASQSNKDIMIAETGSPEFGVPQSCALPDTSKASWITAAYNSWLPYRFPRVKRITWFNAVEDRPPNIDFEIDTTLASSAAFHNAMQSLYDSNYFTNWFDNSGGDDWVMAANPAPVNGADILTNLYIGGNLQGETIWPSSAIYTDATRYARVAGLPPTGPVELKSHQLTPNHGLSSAVMSRRTLWPKGGNSLEEILARDYRYLSSHYYWPWYDQQTPGMSDWVVISNMNPFEVYYEISIGGQSQPCGSGNCIIPPNGGSAAPAFPNKQGMLEVKTWVHSLDEFGQERKFTPAYCVPSQRILYNNDFTEIPGTPASELSNDYVWPWYDDLSSTFNWIMIANPNPTEVSYEVKIAGEVKLPPPGCDGTLGPNEVAACLYQNNNGGPVQVISSGGNMVVSQRVLWSGYLSLDELPGLRSSSLKNQYFWTWYDMYDPIKNMDLLMIVNPNGSPIFYRVKIAGQQQAPPQGFGSIAANGMFYATFPGVMAGPLEITGCYMDEDPCDHPANIITSQRVLWKGSGSAAYFNEVWGTSREDVS